MKSNGGHVCIGASDSTAHRREADLRMFRVCHAPQSKRVEPGNAEYLAFDCVARILTGLIMNKKSSIDRTAARPPPKLCAVWDMASRCRTRFAALHQFRERPRRRIASGLRASATFLRRIIRMVAGGRRRLAISRNRMSATAFSSKTPNLPTVSRLGRLYDYSIALAQNRLVACCRSCGQRRQLWRRGRGAACPRQHPGHVMMLMPVPVWARLRRRDGLLPGWRHARSMEAGHMSARCICSVSPANRSPAAADATGAAWRLTRPFPACRNCSRNSSSVIPGTNSPHPPRPSRKSPVAPHPGAEGRHAGAGDF